MKITQRQLRQIIREELEFGMVKGRPRLNSAQAEIALNARMIFGPDVANMISDMMVTYDDQKAHKLAMTIRRNLGSGGPAETNVFADAMEASNTGVWIPSGNFGRDSMYADDNRNNAYPHPYDP